MEKNLKIFLIVLAVAIVLMILWGVISYFKKRQTKRQSGRTKSCRSYKKTRQK